LAEGAHVGRFRVPVERPGGGLSPHEMDCKAFVMSFFLPYPAFLWKLKD
jgi:hypothetical protein